jgi:hypothetical protein
MLVVLPMEAGVLLMEAGVLILTPGKNFAVPLSYRSPSVHWGNLKK